MDFVRLCFACTADVFWCCGRSTYVSRTDAVLTEVLSQTCINYVNPMRELRGLYSETELPPAAVVRGHTHGKSAAARSSASAFADSLGALAGYDPVFIQGSKADQEKGRNTVRTYHWGKDLNAEPASRIKGEKDLGVFIDVDYYVDMADHLAHHARPVLMYTLQPSAAARSEGEYKYTFNKDGEIIYNVSGGGQYQHKLWNWKGDSVGVSRVICGCWPITYTVYSLERKAVDDDHQLVLATPLRKFAGIFMPWIARRRAACNTLERLNPIEGNFVRLKVDTSDGIRVSTAHVEGYLCANVKVQVDEAIGVVANSTKSLTHASVMSKMAGPGGDPLTTAGSEVLLAYYLELTGKIKGRLGESKEMVSAVDGVRSYQYVKNYASYEPGPPSMVAFMKPIIDGAFVPDRSRNNDERTVQTRVRALQDAHGDQGSDTVENVEARRPSAPPAESAATGNPRASAHPPRPPRTKAKSALGGELTPFMLTCMKEFAEELLRWTGKLHPVDYETVYEKQSRPTQRRILEDSEHQTDDGAAAAMQKAEAYQNPNDPRNITVINGAAKREHSKWLYAFYEGLTNVPWYAFGKKPKWIADRIAYICEQAELWADSDFHRQDGNVDRNARIFERIVMMTVFDAAYHAELQKSMRSQTFLNVKTRFGVKYNSGWTRASGSAETAGFNTILTAFIMYLAFRMTRKPNGAYYTAREAWDALGLYGGDDGGTPNLMKSKAEKAAQMMGQQLEILIIPRGEPGVQFLARHYGPDVWFGDNNSCCDLKRQLSKFHVTPHLNRVSETEKLLEKSFAFSLCDSETPLVGNLVKKVLALHPYTRENYENKLGIWNSDLDVGEHYPNVFALWMVDLAVRQMPDFDLPAYHEWIEGCQDLDSILACPGFCDVRPPVARPGLVVVDGEFMGQPGRVDVPAARQRHRPRTHNACRDRTVRPPNGGRDGPRPPARRPSPPAAGGGQPRRDENRAANTGRRSATPNSGAPRNVRG